MITATKTIKTKNVTTVLELFKRMGLREITIQITAPQPIKSNQDTESQLWLNAPLDGELPPYQWEDTGLPKVKQVRYKAKTGFVVEE